MNTLLLVTDAWVPQVNGVVRTLQKTIELLEQQGWHVILVEPSQFLHIPFFIVYPEIDLALFPFLRLASLLKKERPTHVHIATEGPLGLAMRYLCQRRGIAFTTSYHTHFPLYLKSRGAGALVGPTMAFLRWFHRASVRTFVTTESLKKDLESQGFMHLSLWPLGVDTALFHPVPRAEAGAGREPVFLYVGRLAAEKNVEEFCALTLPGKKVLVGDGPLRAKLERKYGKEYQFLGYLFGEELARTVATADVFVFPSTTETFGLVVIEAMACGVPVAAHNVMGPKDSITSGVDGYLDDDLGKAAIQCLTLSREACRQKALTYSWDASVRAFLSNLTPVSR